MHGAGVGWGEPERGLQEEDHPGRTAAGGTDSGEFLGVGTQAASTRPCPSMSHCPTSAGVFFWFLMKRPIPQHLLCGTQAMLLICRPASRAWPS